MRAQSKHPWLYVLAAFVAVMLGGYFYDIQDKLAQQVRQRETEKYLLDQLSDLNKRVSNQNEAATDSLIMLPHQGQVDLLSDLLVQVHMSGLAIKSVSFGSKSKLNFNEAAIVHLLVLGDFEQMSSLIGQLSRQARPMLVLDFSGQSTERNKLIFSMDVLILKSKMKNSGMEPIGGKSIFNPFCFSGNAALLSSENDASHLDSLSLKQMKMVGYLQQGGYRQAYILLPNKSVFVMTPGSLIGKERGLVLKIERDHALLELQAKKRFVINMYP